MVATSQAPGGDHEDRQKASALTRSKVQKGRYLVKTGDRGYLGTCQGGVQKRGSLGTGDFEKAHELLGRAGFPESELTGSVPDPIPLAM